jgi:hypothetical protein
MQANMGDRERLLRTIFGVYGMLLGFLLIQGVVGIIIGVIGAIALLTGLTGFCGIYALLGRPPVQEESGAEDAAEVEAPDKEKE